MFIATTPTPKHGLTEEDATKDFLHLLGRTCEYIKNLEDLGRIKPGSYMPLYEQIIDLAKKSIKENWNA